MRKALVCFSGGVDSTGAILISLRGYQRVRAVFVDTRGRGLPPPAEETAAALGVPLDVADGGTVFLHRVVEPSEKAYARGLTPNPCVLCNARVKLATAFAMLDGDETLVTGHYAGFKDGFLKRGIHRAKDQSYFLGMVPEEILRRCDFPLGSLSKPDVRRLVAEAGVLPPEKESQDLCFEMDRRGRPGDIVSVDGRMLGTHRGLGGYTIGQRRGIGAHRERMFVVRIDPLANSLVVGAEEHLMARGCLVTGVNDLGLPREDSFQVMVQLRSRHRACSAEALRVGEGISVRFRSPQRAVAPGQTAVFYRGNAVLGAGTIGKVRLCHDRSPG